MTGRPPDSVPRWLDDAVMYQVYPQSYCDSNADGVGDLPGLISKLDYIQGLGVNCIWLNPCFDSPFRDAGFDIRDFYKIAPRYGTNADMERLCRAAHRRGIRVCLELVPGHTSWDCEWFRQSCTAKRNRHSDWYVWSNGGWDYPEDQKFIAGWSDRPGSYLSNFFFHQPALNYGYYRPDPRYPWQLPMDHPSLREVRHEMKKVMSHWMDKGADGFHVDMAFSLVKGDPKGTGIRKLWREYRHWFSREYPEGVLCSEWSDPKEAIGAGFHVDFMIHFTKPDWWALFRVPDPSDKGVVPGFFHRSGKGRIRDFLDPYLRHRRGTLGKGLICLPAANHDSFRPMYRRSPEEVAVIQACMLTMPGIPMIYYGDEIGMRTIEGLPSKEGAYHRAGSRTPMQWNRSRNAGFSTAAKKNLYLPVDPDSRRPNVAAAEKDPNSLLHLIRNLLKLRREYPALGNTAAFEPLFAENRKTPFVYLRRKGRQRVVVAINPAEKSVRRTVQLNASTKSIQSLIASGAEARPGRNGDTLRIHMDPVSFGVFLVR